ncbi:MAG: HAD family hydrolase [Myxococcota bacterium]
MPLLALDFDGVISDSAPECFWVAQATFHELRTGRLTDLACEPAPPAPDGVRADPRYAAFLQGMPLGNRAEDFGVLLGEIEAGRLPADQAAYDQVRAAIDAAWIDRFHARFYARRHALAERHPGPWHALMQPYPGIAEGLRALRPVATLAIATSKDRATVDELLQRDGCADLFPPDHILDKETGREKTAHLRALAERTGISAAETLFVDDKWNHLARVSELGVRCALAAWGPNGEREHRGACDDGHILLERETWVEQLQTEWLQPLGGAPERA